MEAYRCLRKHEPEALQSECVDVDVDVTDVTGSGWCEKLIDG